MYVSFPPLANWRHLSWQERRVWSDRRGGGADWLLRTPRTDSQSELWAASARRGGLDMSLIMHKCTHVLCTWHILLLGRWSQKPHKHIRRRQVSHLRGEGRKEKEPKFCLNTFLFSVVLALTFINDAASLLPLFLSHTLAAGGVCVCMRVSTLVGSSWWWEVWGCAVQVMWLMRSDLISCKCKRSEGIHFGLRAPLCTGHEILSAVSLFVHRCH